MQSIFKKILDTTDKINLKERKIINFDLYSHRPNNAF